MRTHHRTRGFSTRPQRGLRTHQVLRPIAGQCFEIDIRFDSNRWLIRIPEINDATEATSRDKVELAARECIATRTGIPIGYISVWVRD
nr:long chain fatty acid-CoA synthetase Faa4p [Mycolicibacterium sp. P1-5]